MYPVLAPFLETWIGLLVVIASITLLLVSQVIERIRTSESHSNTCCSYWKDCPELIHIFIYSSWFVPLFHPGFPLYRHLLASVSIPFLFHSVPGARIIWNSREMTVSFLEPVFSTKLSDPRKTMDREVAKGLLIVSSQLLSPTPAKHYLVL